MLPLRKLIAQVDCWQNEIPGSSLFQIGSGPVNCPRVPAAHRIDGNQDFTYCFVIF
jgi:hypothetical protein